MRHCLLVLLPSLLLFACDSSAEKPVPAKAGDAKAKDAKSDVKAPDVKTDEKADAEADAKADAEADAKADGADETGADETGADAKAGADGAAKAFAIPATAEEAARQLAQRLSAPAETPEPALMSASTDIELVEFCAGCDDPKEDSKSSKLGAADLEKRAAVLAEESGAGALTFEEKVECKDDCCTFVPDPELGVGDNVVNLEKICMKLDGGKPTAYTRVEVSS